MAAKPATKADKAIKPFIISEAISEGREDRPDPYPVQFEEPGDVFYLADPEQLDWQDAYLAAASESPFEVLALIVPDDQAGEFFDRTITVSAMKQLVKGWRDHYGIDEDTYTQGGGELNRAQRRALQRRKAKKK